MSLVYGDNMCARLVKGCLTAQYAGSCPDYLFHCGNNDCIDPQLVCNDVRNCLSGLDELHCHTTATAIGNELCELYICSVFLLFFLLFV